MTLLLKKIFGRRKVKRIPPPGRKMTKQEAREYVFTKYGETMALLAES